LCPTELEGFLDDDGYFKFGITCVRQAQFLLKIIFNSDVKLIYPKMFVGDIQYLMKIDKEGVFIGRTNEKRNRIPESNNTRSIVNDKVLDLTHQLKFTGQLNRDDILNCLNFISQDRKSTRLNSSHPM
jgi:hypothetical protein